MLMSSTVSWISIPAVLNSHSRKLSTAGCPKLTPFLSNVVPPVPGMSRLAMSESPLFVVRRRSPHRLLVSTCAGRYLVLGGAGMCSYTILPSLVTT